MRYSFTTPQPKYLLEANTKAWLMSYGATLLVVLAMMGIISGKAGQMQERTQELESRRAELVQKIMQADEDMAQMEQQRKFGEEVYGSNGMLKESVRNLFELVPDQITLTQVTLERNALIINGITPSKEVYNFLLAVPLKSIFNDSKAEFYLMPNSWYSFESINRLEE